jgi:F-box/TPR repeat protein Pof3
MAKEAIDEEGVGPLERGRNRYQQKNYSGALDAFTEVSVCPGSSFDQVCLSILLTWISKFDRILFEIIKVQSIAQLDTDYIQAITLSTGHLLITALDARAAAYEKLQQLQPALRDAKRIIDLKPELSKVRS